MIQFISYSSLYCKMWSSVVIILSFATVVLSSTKSTKSYISIGGFICPREGNLIGTCLKEVFNHYIPQLAIGLPEFNIPPFEALPVKSLSLKHTAGPISVNVSFSNVYVKEPSSMRVKNVKIDTKDQASVVDLYIPELKLTGEYKLNGTLIMIPIESDGYFTAKYQDINAKITVKLGRKEILSGPDVLSCERLDVKFLTGETTMDMENLFGDDVELSTRMKKFFKENWQSMSGQLQTPIEETLRDFLKPIADRTFATLEADDILILTR